MKKKQGFTLIEVLVAATIITVLAAIGLSSYSSANKRSRDSKRKNDIEQLRSALEMYRSDNGWYPSRGSGNWTNVSTLEPDLVSTYMPSIPKDPKDSTQKYWYMATNLSSGFYYGYCLTTYLEISGDTSSCTAYSGGQPSGTYPYGAKSP